MDLFKAVKNGDVELVRKLVTTENVNFQDKNMSTPLMVAAEHKDAGKSLQMVQILLNAGADVNMTNKWQSNAILYASTTNKTNVMKLLLKAGADVHHIDITGDNLLIWPSYEGNIDMVKLLLDLGVNPNIQNNVGNTPLTLSIKHPNVIKLLLEAGANPDIQDDDRDTPLNNAVKIDNLETVKLLLEAGANPDIQDDYGDTPLNNAVRINNLETVKLLLKAGANPDIQDNYGVTPLMMAVGKKNLAMIQLLGEYGANPFLKNANNKNALDYCPDNKCEYMISKLIWKRLYQRDLDTAQRYAKNSSTLDKDTWSIILLNKRQQQLCQNLSSEKNKLILYEFALEFGMPVKEDMTKAQLCGMISRYLVYGKHSTNKPIEEENKFINEIKVAARARGINPELPVPEILRLLSTMF